MKTSKKETKTGMTLIELTVVILVILSLISLLFVGFYTWKKGADWSKCTNLNIRGVQKAVRDWQTKEGLKPGDLIVWDEIFGEGKYFKERPKCPSEAHYYYESMIPEEGELVIHCQHKGDPEHVPITHDDW